MKKRITVLIVLLAMVLTATTVYGIFADDKHGSKLIKKGYTEQDLIEIDAILLYSDANVIEFITQKYEELGDWKKVREYYGVDEVEYQNYIKGRAEWQKVLDSVPEKVMVEMKAEMTLREINQFVNKINIAGIDFEIAWEKYKSGKTVDEIVAEKEDENKKHSELIKKFINDEITIKEYEKALSEVVKDDKITIGKILSEATTKRTKIRNMYKKQSGINKEEISYCEKKGLTNPMDMFQAKEFSKGNNIPFKKVVDVQLKNKDWIKTVAELLNIPEEEYRKEVEIARAN